MHTSKFLFLFGLLALARMAQAATPNVICILADDLGYGDLSCYGQETLKTPNLDRLAANGIRFTRHYAGATVCAPSRYVLMSGKHSGHGSIRDNGPHHEGNHDHAFFNSNGDLQGYKRALYNGGIRVPFIASWPGTIPAGRESGLMSGFQDMMPTMAELIGTEVSDTGGVSLLPALKGDPEAQRKHEFLYWEYPETSGKQALLYLNQWKAEGQGLHEDKRAPVELYDITVDIGERNNLAAVHPGLARQLFDLMMNQHVPFNENWDLSLD